MKRPLVYNKIVALTITEFKGLVTVFHFWMLVYVLVFGTMAPSHGGSGAATQSFPKQCRCNAKFLTCKIYDYQKNKFCNSTDITCIYKVILLDNIYT
jgi:hypothetical protein